MGQWSVNVIKQGNKERYFYNGYSRTIRYIKNLYKECFSKDKINDNKFVFEFMRLTLIKNIKNGINDDHEMLMHTIRSLNIGNKIKNIKELLTIIDIINKTYQFYYSLDFKDLIDRLWLTKDVYDLDKKFIKKYKDPYILYKSFDVYDASNIMWLNSKTWNEEEQISNISHWGGDYYSIDYVEGGIDQLKDEPRCWLNIIDLDKNIVEFYKYDWEKEKYKLYETEKFSDIVGWNPLEVCNGISRK